MRKQIDHFLLGILWCLAVALGSSFWFNVRFGFNVFAAENWAYLGELQATGTPITATFYISIAVAVGVLIFGLYLILRPRFRKIAVSRQSSVVSPPPPTPQSPQHSTSNIQHSAPPAAAASMRPPRLTLPKINSHQSSVVSPPSTNDKIQTTDDRRLTTDDMDQAFTDAGYIVKKSPRVGGMRPILFAIGAGETLWIGADAADAAKLTDSVEKLRALFTETLDDIPITINSFVLGAGGGDALSFANADELREYIIAHPNPEITAAARDDFDAFSDYIDTVASYFDKSVN
jgi:hypothetical protein